MRYARVRYTFGKRLADHQVIRHKVILLHASSFVVIFYIRNLVNSWAVLLSALFILGAVLFVCFVHSQASTVRLLIHGQCCLSALACSFSGAVPFSVLFILGAVLFVCLGLFIFGLVRCQHQALTISYAVETLSGPFSGCPVD